MADEQGFVRRWSRRKSAAREQAREAEPAPPAAEAPAPAAAPEGPGQGEVEVAEPVALPDIESLTYQSDFTPFLRPGVPAELRNRALQRLWRSDPVLANLDGLVEYGEDYSQVGKIKEVVRTVYRVGRGLLDRIEAAAPQAGDDAAEDEPAGDEPAATPPPKTPA